MSFRVHKLRPLGALIAAMACSEVAEVLTPALASDAGTDAGSDAPLGDAAPDVAAPDVTTPDGAVPLVTLDAGSSHACATIDGRLYCWGANQRGRLGVGDAMDRLVATRVGEEQDWALVTTAQDHSCALRAGGSLYCFGVNDNGQLGVPDVAEALEPRAVALPSAVRSVSAEALFSCALSELGELYCWGENLEGQLGQNDGFPGANQPTPVRVESWTDFLHVDVGQGHTCAIREPGTLWCWGRNTGSELGFGEGAPVQTRAAGQTGTGTSWVDADAGQHHSCAIESNGPLWCWGDNQFGNLGTGDFTLRTTPTQIAPERSFVQVSLDTFHTCAIDSEAELWCWGRNVEGQLGVGDTVDRTLPERVPGGGFAFVAVGRFFTCAVRLDGTIWCAGANESGQLGTGDTDRRNALSPIVMPVD